MDQNNTSIEVLPEKEIPFTLSVVYKVLTLAVFPAIFSFMYITAPDYKIHTIKAIDKSIFIFCLMLPMMVAHSFVAEKTKWWLRLVIKTLVFITTTGVIFFLIADTPILPNSILLFAVPPFLLFTLISVFVLDWLTKYITYRVAKILTLFSLSFLLLVFLITIVTVTEHNKTAPEYVPSGFGGR
jgi:hypothetical protein